MSVRDSHRIQSDRITDRVVLPVKTNFIFRQKKDLLRAKENHLEQ